MKQIFWSHADSEKFYRSEAWTELKKVFKASLPRGQKHKCSCCGKICKSVHVDHIVPISIDPSKRLDITNLQILCPECNRGKSNKDMSRMSSLTPEQRAIKASQFKKEFYTKRWFAPTSKKALTRKQNKWKDGFF